jgi:hypothetical protein
MVELFGEGPGFVDVSQEQGRNEDQSFGEWRKSVVLPLASVTGIATAALPPEARMLSVPDPSRYFCVGHTNE